MTGVHEARPVLAEIPDLVCDCSAAHKGPGIDVAARGGAITENWSQVNQFSFLPNSSVTQRAERACGYAGLRELDRALAPRENCIDPDFTRSLKSPIHRLHD